MFDRAQLVRRSEVDLARGASFLGVGMLLRGGRSSNRTSLGRLVRCARAWDFTPLTLAALPPDETNGYANGPEI